MPESYAPILTGAIGHVAFVATLTNTNNSCFVIDSPSSVPAILLRGNNSQVADLVVQAAPINVIDDPFRPLAMMDGPGQSMTRDMPLLSIDGYVD
jgi:hypothetical protein